MREIIERNYRRAKDLLSSNMEILHAMAEALLDRETLGADEIELLMKGVKLPPKPTTGGNTPSEPQGTAPATNEGAVGSGIISGNSATPAPV